MTQPSNKRFLLESDKGIAGGIATLDGGSKIPTAQLPDTYVPTSQKGTLGGVASLDGSGVVPDGQLPDRVSAASLAKYAPDESFHATKYGAKFDAVTDDTAAIQAAINACSAAGGGNVILPHGDSIVNGGLVWPINKMIRLIGQGVSASGGIFATRLKRTTGTAPIITAAGTGQGANQRALIELHNLAFYGGDLPASVLKLSRTSLSYLNNIRISNNNGGSGLEIREMWDSRMHCVYVQLCGGSGTIPAVLFGEVAGEAVAAISDGIHITTMAIHSSYGPDLKITGDITKTAPSSNLQFVNLNIEGTGAGTAGAPDTYENVVLDYAQNCTFTNTRISLPTGRASANVINQSSGGSGNRANQFTNTVLDMAGTSSPNNWVQQTGGALMFNNININGAPTNAYFNVTSGVTAGRFKLRNLVHNSSNVASGFIADGRSVPERIGRPSVPFRPATSTNAPVSLGTVVAYPLNDGASEALTGVVPIPADADPNGKCTIRVHWSAAATGNVVFRWVGKTMAAGDDPSAAATNRDLTVAANATAGRVTVTEWTVSTLGFTSVPGGSLLVQLMRLGADAADTCAATVNVIAVEMVYHQRL